MGTRAPPASRYKGAAGRRPEGGTGVRTSKTKQNKTNNKVEQGRENEQLAQRQEETGTS